MDDAVIRGMPVGRKSRSPGRTIGEGLFSMLTSITWTNDELHSNAEAMRRSEYGERLLGGSVLLALVSGLYCQNPLFRDLLSKHGVRPVAALGTQASYRGAFLPGDTLWEETEVLGVRLSATMPGRGILELRDVGYNQRGDVVVDSTRAILYER